jgi:O-antigen ligase
MVLFLFLVSLMALLRHPFWARYVGGMTMIKYLGVACVLYALCHLAVRRRIPRYFQSWQAWGLLLLFVIAGLSEWTRGAKFSWETSSFLSYASFVLLFFLTLSIVDSVQRLHLVLLAIVGSIGWASLYVLREWQKYHNVYAEFRPGWVVGDANYFSVSALIAVPIAVALMLEKRPLWERLFCLGCLIATLAAITVAASRGGFIGLGVAFLFLAVHSGQRVRNLVLAAALLFPLTLLSPISPLTRLLHPTGGDKEAMEARIEAWRAALRMIRAHSVAGIGLDNFKLRVDAYTTKHRQVDHIAHNAYVEIAAEMGVPALLVFLAILYSSYRSLGKVRRQTAGSAPPLLRQGALGLQSGLVGCGVAVFFVSAQYTKFLWLLVSLSVCVASLSRVARQARKPTYCTQPLQRQLPCSAERIAGPWEDTIDGSDAETSQELSPGDHLLIYKLLF